MEKKFCRDIIALVFLVLLSLQIPAQQKALKVGEAIPEDLWSTPLQILNSPQKTTTLSENKDQLILLDFWATWCSACLKNFPKMEALEKQFEGKLKVLAVSNESRALLEKFFLSKNGQRFKNIVSVSDDKILSEAFPHFEIPFVVWIKDGKILNSTGADQVTEKAIKEILENQKSTLKTVLQLSRKRPFMLAEQFDSEDETSLSSYQILTKGLVRAIGSGTGFHRSASTTYGRQFTNLPLINIYKGLAYQIFEDRGDNFNNKRLVVLSQNSEKLEIFDTDSEAERNGKYYNFEFIGPVSRSKFLHEDMLSYLNQYSGFTATLEVQKKKCIILSQRNKKNPTSKVTLPIAETKVKGIAEGVVQSLNDTSLTTLPILIESGSRTLIPRSISKLKNFDDVKKELMKEGFELDIAERELLMLVIRDLTDFRPIN
ncbi:TlpA family protein disulfide reductase [Chryseobacterium sp. A301]